MAVVLAVLKEILGDESLRIVSQDSVASGLGTKYFYKFTSTAEEQYEGESESLQLLFKAAPGLSPKLIFCQKVKNGTLFISEYIDLGGHLGGTGFDELAKRLASEVHQYKSDKGFGWSECYSSMIEELLSQLRAQEYLDLYQKGEELREKAIPALLDPLSIQPVLLHGDLWSGNVSLDRQTRKPMIYDPACYFGHNEADLAIARIFGGFPESFFVTYHRFHPKTEPEDQYAIRQDLYEVFHYLNHTLLFGGGYEQSAQWKIQNVLDFVSNELKV